ncbi:MAG: hypothetical protein IPH54_15365 [Rhodoferax sp.]|nr:hypothetical protein [Rhodoferax sp.]
MLCLHPLYDALCTAVLPTLTEKMAMKIGKYKFSEVQVRHWEQFAKSGVVTRAGEKADFGHRQALARPSACYQGTFESQGNGHPIIDQIVTLIDQRCALTIRRLTAPQFDEPPPELLDHY